VPERFLPHLARLVRVDVEALELHARGRAARAEVDAAVREEIEHRGRLGTADRVVVRRGEEAHAVPDADVLGTRRDRAVEHFGVRAVRVLLEEVVLDRPERVEPDLVTEDRLLEGVLVGLVLGVGLPGLGHRDLVEESELHGHGGAPACELEQVSVSIRA